MRKKVKGINCDSRITKELCELENIRSEEQKVLRWAEILIVYLIRKGTRGTVEKQQTNKKKDPIDLSLPWGNDSKKDPIDLPLPQGNGKKKDPIDLDSPWDNDSKSIIDSLIRDIEETIIRDIEETVPPFESTLTCSDLEKITDSLLSSLTPVEERILRMHFGLGMESDPTPEEVVEHFPVTKKKMRQIEAKALRKLQHPKRIAKLKQSTKNKDSST
jgi:hypothetical protein